METGAKRKRTRLVGGRKASLGLGSSGLRRTRSNRGTDGITAVHADGVRAHGTATVGAAVGTGGVHVRAAVGVVAATDGVHVRVAVRAVAGEAGAVGAEAAGAAAASISHGPLSVKVGARMIGRMTVLQ